MRLIDADALRERMCHEVFDTDSDMQKWDSGCWLRYKLFENVLRETPTVDAVEVKHGQGMKKYIVLGGYEPYIIEAEDWESAFWKAFDCLKECLVSITVIPEEEE